MPTAFWLIPQWTGNDNLRDGAEAFWMREPAFQLKGEESDLKLIADLWRETSHGKAEIIRRHLRGRGYAAYDLNVSSPLT